MHSDSNTKKLDTFGDVCKGADTRQIYNAPTNVHKVQATPRLVYRHRVRARPGMANAG